MFTVPTWAAVRICRRKFEQYWRRGRNRSAPVNALQGCPIVEQQTVQWPVYLQNLSHGQVRIESLK